MIETPNYDATLYRIQRDLFVKETYMLTVGQVTEWHIQTWIDYGLGMPDPDTGFGIVWYDMMNRTIRVAKGDYVPTGQGYWLDSVMGYVELTQASKANALNKDVSLWWSNTKTIIKTFMRV